MTSCMTYQGLYNIGLKNVERPEDAKERYGESKIISFPEGDKTKYSYEDDMIRIVWYPSTTQFDFTMHNKTDHSIKIIWDEAVYVNENGSSGRVIHTGVRFIDKNYPQPPSVIAKNTDIEDLIIPADNIKSESGPYSGWIISPLFPYKANTKKELGHLTEKYIGKEVKVLLPLEIQGIINEYIFEFEIEDFEVEDIWQSP